ncbi:hypothetical protein HDV00_005224 [Rhizophlyctis rosea]|nr:hypothetical protein HDV00_005224 [Rhizophlyctis rosea]
MNETYEQMSPREYGGCRETSVKHARQWVENVNPRLLLADEHAWLTKINAKKAQFSALEYSGVVQRMRELPTLRTPATFNSEIADPLYRLGWKLRDVLKTERAAKQVLTTMDAAAAQILHANYGLVPPPRVDHDADFQLKEYDGELAKVNSETVQLKTELDNKTAEVVQLDARLSEYMKSAAELKSQMAEVVAAHTANREKETKAFNARVSTLESEKVVLEKEKATLEKRVKGLEEVIDNIRKVNFSKSNPPSVQFRPDKLKDQLRDLVTAVELAGERLLRTEKSKHQPTCWADRFKQLRSAVDSEVLTARNPLPDLTTEIQLRNYIQSWMAKKLALVFLSKFRMGDSPYYQTHSSTCSNAPSSANEWTDPVIGTMIPAVTNLNGLFHVIASLDESYADAWSSTRDGATNDIVTISRRLTQDQNPVLDSIRAKFVDDTLIEMVAAVQGLVRNEAIDLQELRRLADKAFELRLQILCVDPTIRHYTSDPNIELDLNVHQCVCVRGCNEAVGVVVLSLMPRFVGNGDDGRELLIREKVWANHTVKERDGVNYHARFEEGIVG